MRVIIAGSRNLDVCMDTLHELDQIVKIELGWEIEEVVCGGATGADTLGKLWARLNKVPVKMFEANWGTYGKNAGPIRNREMAFYADALILLWDGESRGSANMLKQAEKYGLIISNQKLSGVYL